MAKFISISVSIPFEILDRIDKERGDESRSEFIRNIIAKEYS